MWLCLSLCICIIIQDFDIMCAMCMYYGCRYTHVWHANWVILKNTSILRASETHAKFVHLQTADKQRPFKQREQFNSSVRKLAISLLESLIRDGLSQKPLRAEGTWRDCPSRTLRGDSVPGTGGLVRKLWMDRRWRTAPWCQHQLIRRLSEILMGVPVTMRNAHKGYSI